MSTLTERMQKIPSKMRGRNISIRILSRRSRAANSVFRGRNCSNFQHIRDFIYLSIFLYVLTPEGDIRRVPGNQVLGVSCFFFVSFCAMLVVLVVSERRASACLIMLSAKQGSHWYHFNAFGMATPGIEPTTSRSRSGRSTICAIGTGCPRYLQETLIFQMLKGSSLLSEEWELAEIQIHPSFGCPRYLQE